METIIPSLPDDYVRLNCLQMATEFADTPQETLRFAMMFQEYVENGCAGICGGCLKAMRE